MSSVRRAIRTVLVEVVNAQTATAIERLEACRLLIKLETSARKGHPRGKPFPKKNAERSGEMLRDRFYALLEPVSDPETGHACR